MDLDKVVDECIDLPFEEMRNRIATALHKIRYVDAVNSEAMKRLREKRGNEILANLREKEEKMFGRGTRGSPPR